MEIAEEYKAAEIYNEIAEQYDGLARSVQYDATHLYKLAKPHLNTLTGNKLLDLGCGTGLASQPFSAHQFIVHGIDVAPKMIEIFLSKNFASRGVCRNVATEGINYDPNYFDIIISNGLLCFFQDFSPIMGEVARVIKKNGIFSFNYENNVQNSSLIRSGLRVYQHTKENLTNILSALNFKILNKERYCAFLTYGYLPVYFEAVVCRKN